MREMVSPGLAAVIERCIDTHLARCYHTAGEVVHDLQAESDALAGASPRSPHALAANPAPLEGVPPRHASLIARLKNNPRLGRVGLIAIGALAVIAILLLTAAISRRSPFRTPRFPRSGQPQSQSTNTTDGKQIVPAQKGNP